MLNAAVAWNKSTAAAWKKLAAASGDHNSKKLYGLLWSYVMAD
jgi:hypothetical protein